MRSGRKARRSRTIAFVQSPEFQACLNAVIAAGCLPWRLGNSVNARRGHRTRLTAPASLHQFAPLQRVLAVVSLVEPSPGSILPQACCVSRRMLT